MKVEALDYFHGKTKCKGIAFFEEKGAQKKPAILVVHAWRGQDEFCREKAAFLARQGYVGFAVDMYGEGRHTKSNDEAAELMKPYFLDRHLLKARILAAYDALKKHSHVDPEKMGAIGFCFGGMTVIELFRSGANLKATVSFHGLLGHKLVDWDAKKIAIAKKVHGSLLILHGNDDPLVSAADIAELQKELTEAAADWQMVTYGGTMHAFTNPEAHFPESGMQFQLRSAKRAWRAMENLFEEAFSIDSHNTR